MPPADDDNVRFAFAPALAIEGLLDYSKSDHVKIFRGAIKPVSETPFDCEADGLHQFLRDVHDRADEMGWTKGILKIGAEEDEDEERIKRENLIDHYGSITLERIVETEEENIVNQGKKGTDKKAGGKKDGDAKKEGDHPKKWQAPKSGDKKEAMYKGHMWYWCGKETGGKCEKWRAHKPKECKGIANAGTKREGGENDKKDNKKHLAKKLKVAKAYIARIEKQAAEAETTSGTDSDDE